MPVVFIILFELFFFYFFPVPQKCKTTKLFPIVRIPGSMLVGQGYKRINRLLTREQCMEKCLYEREIVCRSAHFILSYRNNRQRFGRNLSGGRETVDNNDEEVGQCILSRENKFTRPESFKYGQDSEEYFENQCADKGKTEILGTKT